MTLQELKDYSFRTKNSAIKKALNKIIQEVSLEKSNSKELPQRLIELKLRKLKRQLDLFKKPEEVKLRHFLEQCTSKDFTEDELVRYLRPFAYKFDDKNFEQYKTYCYSLKEIHRASFEQLIDYYYIQKGLL